MPSVFTRIIDGDLPGRFVWRDEQVVAFLSIGPLSPGHTLVVPRAEVDHWLDLDPAVWQRIGEVTREVGRGIDRAFRPARVGTAIVGFEVPHCHVHVVGLQQLSDLDFTRADANPDPDALDRHAELLRAALRDLGHADLVP